MRNDGLDDEKPARGMDQENMISVVIACVNGLPSIAECLAALQAQDGNHTAEVVVVNCCDDGTAEHIATYHPDVVLINKDTRRGIPELRALGIAHATGDLIAIIEDHCMVRPSWLNEIVQAQAQGFDAVGGPVENGSTERLVDRAVFLTEYSDMMLPVPDGEVPGVAGNNVAYQRAAFEVVPPDVLRNDWEYFVQQAMRAKGLRFCSVPTMVVDHKKHFGFWYFMSQRFHYSRSFAAMRRRRISASKQVIYAAASPVLVPLMLYRIGRQVFRKRREQATFVLGLPVLLAFMFSYAAGECVGYLAGPGNSLERVE